MHRYNSRLALLWLLAAATVWCAHTAADAQPTGVVSGAVRTARDAGLPDTVIERLMMIGLDHHLPPGEVASLITLVVDIHREGLAPEPFISKIAEGVGKRIPADRITAALNRRLDQQRRIRRAVKRCLSPDEPIPGEALARLGQSLSLGLSIADVEAIVCHSEKPSLDACAVAAEMKALMEQIGFTSTDTDRLIAIGLRRHTLGPDWRKLPMLAASAIKRGIPRTDIVHAAARRLEAEGSIRRLMPELAFTGRDLKTGPISGNRSGQTRPRPETAPETAN